IDSSIVERRQGDVAHDGNTVLEVRKYVRITTGIDDGLCWNGNLYRSTSRIRGIHRHEAAIWILQRNVHTVANEHIRSDGTNVEAPNVVFAADIRALIRRSDLPVVTSNERALHAESKCVPAFVHREPMFVFDDRPDGVHISANTGELAGQKQARAAMRLKWTIDAVEGETRRDLAGANSAQR